MVKKWTIALLLAATLTMSACSSGLSGLGGGSAAGAADGDSSGEGGNQGGSPGTVDVCAALPAQAMTAITGVSYATATSSAAGSGGCTYQPTDTTKYVGIDVWVEPGDDSAWTDDVATIKSDDGSANPVSGAGARAVVGFKEFAAEQGNHIVQVINGDYDGSSGNPQFPHSIAIANALFAALS